MNMMRLFIPSLITLLTLSAFSQQKQGSAVIPINRKLEEISVVDSTRLRVWYAMNADSINNMDTYIDFQRLDVGDSISKYYSWFVHNNDSLLRDWYKMHPKAQSAPIWLGPGGKKQSTWIQYEYSDLYIQNGILTEYACMPHGLGKYNSQYSEPIPRHSWVISFDTQEILGYTCQKAMCHFRGRNYIAWFALDIPVRQGPWKLNGLPGLILKAHDVDTLYTFEAVKIEKGRFPIVRCEYKDYKEESRIKVQKMQREFSENWNKAVGTYRVEILPNGETERKEPVSIYTSYEPLELE